MTRRSVLACVVGLALSSSGLALAQATSAPPKPGPEHKRLSYFVGTWKSEGEMKENPFMPAGKFASTETCEWFEGGFALVCRSEGKGPSGPTKGLGIMSYSPDEKVYLYYGIESNSPAMASVSRGVLTGDAWTYSDEYKMAGKTVKGRFVMKETSPTSYTFKWEVQGEDGGWTTIVEGKATKSK